MMYGFIHSHGDAGPDSLASFECPLTNAPCTLQLSSLPSSASDRSSLSSGSPSSSPLSHQAQPVPAHISPPYSLAAPVFQPSSTSSSGSSSNSHHAHHAYGHLAGPHMKIHQPAAQRARKVIPIVNPTTGMRVASPPLSLSPGRLQAGGYARRW